MNDPQSEAASVQEPEYSPHLPIVTLLLLVGLAFALSMHQLLLLTESWPIAERLSEDWLFVSSCAVNALISLLLWRKVYHSSDPYLLNGWLLYFGLVNLIAFAIALANEFDLLHRVVFLILNYVLPIIVSVLSAFAYFHFFALAKGIDNRLFAGYRLPLRLGFFGLGLFSLLYIFEIPSAFFATFTLFVCLCVLLAYTRVGRILDQSARRFGALVFVALFLGGPVAVYVHKHSAFLEIFGQAGAELFEIITNPSERGSVSISETADEEEADQQPLSITKNYNDYWLLSDQERLAVSDDALLKSNDGGESWKKVKNLAFYGGAIHFDSSAKRGWVGQRYDGLEVTEDGGDSWRKVTTESVYREVTGKRYRESRLRDISQLHLDPETGFGSFTGRCQYFYTRDFAKTWQSIVVTLAGGEKACVLDTPFAINQSQTLALAGGMLLQRMYRFDETKGYWQPVCDLESDLSNNTCESMSSLSEEDKAFARHSDWTPDYLFGGARAHPDIQTQIALLGQALVSEMKDEPPVSGGVHWFASDDFLATSNDSGQHWSVEKNRVDIEQIFPVNEKIAFAFSTYYGSDLWISRDAGSSWQLYLSASEERWLDHAITSNGEYLWLLFPDKLMRIDTKNQSNTVVERWTSGLFDQIEASSDGRALWLYQRGGYASSASFDSGKTWHAFEARKVQRSHAGKWKAASVQDMDCVAATSSCLLLRTDSSLSEVLLEEGELRLASLDAIALVPREIEHEDGGDDYDSGGSVLEFSDNGKDVLVIADEGRHAYLSTDKGESWTHPTLGDESYWYESYASANDLSIVAKGEEKISISHDFGRTWEAVDPIGWEDSDLRLCWGAEGKLIYLVDDEHMAKSTDGGKSWSQYDPDTLNDPVCGIGNGFVWLRKSEIEVHALDENDEK